MTDRTISPPGSPLRRRMTEDMTIRGFTLSTRRGYLAAVENFTAFLGRPPDRSDAEDLRHYQLHMGSIGASATTMNAEKIGASRKFLLKRRILARCQEHERRAAPPTPITCRSRVSGRRRTRRRRRFFRCHT